MSSKWASLIPFARAADLLKEVLPVGDLVSAETRRSSRSVELSKVKYSSLNRAVTTQPKRLAQGVVDVGLPSSRIVCRFKCTEPD